MDAGLQCVSRGMTGFRRLTDLREGDRTFEDNGPLRHDRIFEISKEKGEKKRASGDKLRAYAMSRPRGGPIEGKFT